MTNPQIISVAGGKGGIGKSLISTNIAVTLGARGYRVVAVDLDLGASNLHAFVGIKNSQKNILNFAEKSGGDLNAMVLPTKYDGLGIICGAANVAGAANIDERQKARIIDNISSLSADYVILDLGAGSSFNVTDFFLAGSQGIVVIVPEITSLLDAYSFLKSILHRRLEVEWKTSLGVAALIKEFKNPNNELRIHNVNQLIEAVKGVSIEEALRMQQLIQSLQVKVVLNKVRNKKDFQVIKTIQSLARTNLNLMVADDGYIPYDAEVARSVNMMTPFVKTAPRAQATQQIDKLCKSIVQSAQDVEAISA